MSFYLHESADDIAILLSDQGQVVAIFSSRSEAEDAVFEMEQVLVSEQYDFNDAA